MSETFVKIVLVIGDPLFNKVIQQFYFKKTLAQVFSCEFFEITVFKTVII